MPAVKKTEEIDIEVLWKEFFKERNDENRNRLMEYYLPIVKYTAERIYVKLPEKVEVDDLISAGIFGLMDAINAFDSERGVKFATYCTPRIRGSILDELRSMDWVPRLVRARAHQLVNATRMLEAYLGRLPTEQEIADELDMNANEFRRLQRDATAVGLVSLSNNLDIEGDNDICEIDIIEDKKSEDPMIEVQKRDLKSLLTRGLTRAERLILVLYYYEEMTMKEIGATLDLSESRVSQMHSSIIARLKAQMDTRKKEFSINK
jgi:RNA polymerase sigma factor for flagellar operon FliA